MVAAPFEDAPAHVRVAERGTRHGALILGARTDSLTDHLAKRVVLERQWAAGTDGVAYLADLRRAVSRPEARFLVYSRRGGTIAATVTPTKAVLSEDRLGIRWQPHLLVVYSAERGMIIAGYQFSTLPRTGVPPEARWLT